MIPRVFTRLFLRTHVRASTSAHRFSRLSVSCFECFCNQAVMIFEQFLARFLQPKRRRFGVARREYMALVFYHIPHMFRRQVFGASFCFGKHSFHVVDYNFAARALVQICKSIFERWVTQVHLSHADLCDPCVKLIRVWKCPVKASGDNVCIFGRDLRARFSNWSVVRQRMIFLKPVKK